jgi:polyisoprenoid-binding protein YceI
VKHLMISYANGSFNIFDANLYTQGKDSKTAEIDLWIEAASIDTRDAKRDEHLKSGEFLDVKRHQQIMFTSSTIGETPRRWKSRTVGELTIVGITRNIKMDAHFGGMVKDPWRNEKTGFTVSAKINRKDWSLHGTPRWKPVI